MYNKNIPRCSNIVSYVYPFWWDWKIRYLEWLRNNNINEKEYLDWANELWTFVHNQMENFINWDEIEISSPLYKETIDEVKYWIDFLKELKAEKYQSETYLKDKDWLVQGTADLIYKKDWKTILWDYKTFWIVKKRYWKDNKYAVDKKKREKVALQLSIYAYLYNQNHKEKIDWIELLFIHKKWVRSYKLELLDEKHIKNLLIEYHLYLKSKNKEIKDLVINNNNMIITIQAPTEAFWLIKIEEDLSKLDNWKTATENIDICFKTVKHLKQKYLKELISN